MKRRTFECIHLDRKYVNLLLALITGRVHSGNQGAGAHTKWEIWDCKPWMDFFAIHLPVVEIAMVKNEQKQKTT